jgi:murein DD-endopeptidase MepM/ murein hydrolase activator NlpD
MRRESTFEEFLDYLQAWYKYLRLRAGQIFFHFEAQKDWLVDKLMLKRGRYQRPFIHTGMTLLVLLGIMLTPFVAQNYPGLAKNPWEEAESPSAALMSATEADPCMSTQVSEKPRDEVITYEVREGDTISTVAEKFGISTNTILWANNLKDIKTIKPGQKLKILPVTGMAHQVQKGETIYTIAKKFDTEAQGIVDFPFNTFVNDETFALAVGQTLIVPDGVKPKEKPVVPGERYLARKTPDAGTVSALGAFIWPASGYISQSYRWYHPGIDIARVGGQGPAPDILAADAGKVIVAGWPDGRGYGNRVILNHGNGFTTMYAHLAKIYVAAGQTVKRGDPVGKMGSTGRSTGIHLHFEIQHGGVAKDPLAYLK